MPKNLLFLALGELSAEIKILCTLAIINPLGYLLERLFDICSKLFYSNLTQCEKNNARGTIPIPRTRHSRK